MSRGLDDDRGDTRANAWSRGPSREPDTRVPDRRSWSLPDGRFSLPSSMDRQSVWGRDRSYRLRDTESHTLETIGTFHLVLDRDLRDGRYRGDLDRLDDDLKALTAQGLVESRTLACDHQGHGMRVLALTDAGRDLLEDHRTASFSRDRDREDAVHAGFRKRSDLIHNASLYRMYQVEAAAIERGGGTIRHVALEDDLKRDVYRRAHVPSRVSEDLRHDLLVDAARACDIPLVHEHLEFPDVRVEYDMPGGRGGRVDLELVTAQYRGGAIAAKASAGFTLYSAGGCASRGIHSLGGSGGAAGHWDDRSLRTAVPMTHDTRVATLRQTGFPPRHSEFLALVMGHGGYFLRRQVTQFLGGRDGGVTTAFLHHLVRRHVVRVTIGRRGTHLYHVYRKRLYALLDDVENRNRRVVLPAQIVRKLMALDLVLHERRATWLATEAEKVDYLTTTGGVPRTAFPATWYRGRGDAFTGTVRYFVDKAPMSVGADGVLTIAYVQGVEESLAGFHAFLDRYARLCSALPRVHIVWVVPHLGRFARAQAMMTAWGRRTAGLSRIAPTILRRDLTAYCEARRRLETGLRTSLVRDLRRVRELHQRVVEPRFPDLYVQWRERGTLAIDTCVAQERPPDVSRVDLRAVAFPYRYGLFGTAFGVTPPRCHVARSPRRTLGDVAA